MSRPRRIPSSAALVIRTLLVVGGLLAQGACSEPAPQSGPQEARGAWRTADGRDLDRDERDGGHTLSRHVGQSGRDLATRLADDADLRTASSFPDRASAERAVNAALDGQQQRIESWIERGSRRPNLALTVRSADGRPFGITLSRGERAPRPAFAARVVLRARERSFYVLTAYPTEER